MSAVALGVGHGSLTHRGWHPSSTAVGDSHATAKLHNAALHKVQVQSFASSFCVPAPLTRPSGLRSRRYAKLPTLERSPVVGASRSLHALRAVVCRPGGVLALWHMSGALRMVLVSGFAVYIVFAPAHPWGLLASQASLVLVYPSAPQGGSLRPHVYLVGFCFTGL
jgi:hypothetical protein